MSLSLSHSGSRGLCLITADETVIGCDIEFIEARSAGFVEDYFTEPERRLIHAAAGARRTLLPTLLWSAKESALKILHEGLRMDTREVEVRLHEPQPGPWQRMEIEFLAAARVFPGWWREDDGYALTFAADTPAGSPMSCPQRFEADSAMAPLPN